MKKFWVSWWHNAADSSFELHTPWWTTGYRFINEDGSEDASICAALLAEDEDEVMDIITKCHDEAPDDLEIRFIEERPDDWTPFNDRFKKGDWMKWED